MNNLKFYVIDVRYLDEEEASLDFLEISDDLFLHIAKKYGEVYTVKAFETLINNDDFVVANSFIRIIEQ
jgi:hypothetical protein